MSEIKQITSFIKQIKSDAENYRAEIETEMKARRDSELKQAHKIYTDKASRYVSRSVAKGKNEISSEMSARHMASRVDLINKRSRITSDVMSGVEKMLEEYTKTEKYRNSLFESAKLLGEELPSNRVTLYVRETDLCFADEIRAAFGHYCRVDTDTKIKLGGIRGYDQILQKIADDTLDEKLSAEREWFAQYSKLTISVR